MTMFSTVYLDPTSWDIEADVFGNIARASAPYSLAQDVASAARLFAGELYYDTEKGIPYFDEILGMLPPISLFVSYLEGAALTVSGVVSAQCIVASINAREIIGQLQFIDETGELNNVSF